jgi:hydroxymethylpyrimidine pyrophosphatase-like HAD family hydrolase
MPRPHFDLLAIDLDGTLLCPRGLCSPENTAAIDRARGAGLRVTVCTGRGWIECRDILAQIRQADPIVVAGGAILAEPRSGGTLHRFPMHPALVADLVGVLTRHGHAALVLKDPAGVRDHGLAPGHDYLIVSPRGESAIDPVTRWWFRAHGINFRVVPSLDHDDHPEHTVRVGVCGTRAETLAAADELRTAFHGRIVLHHFNAVVPGDHEKHPDDQIVILEAFDRAVTKWNAIEWLAGREGIDPKRIAAIGNDVNDVAMLRAAGLGIAMGNAIPEALAAAARTTLPNDRHGVAHAIDKLLANEW